MQTLSLRLQFYNLIVYQTFTQCAIFTKKTGQLCGVEKIYMVKNSLAE
jgi:hypothetical protein